MEGPGRAEEGRRRGCGSEPGPAAVGAAFWSPFTAKRPRLAGGPGGSVTVLALEGSEAATSRRPNSGLPSQPWVPLLNQGVGGKERYPRKAVLPPK